MSDLPVRYVVLSDEYDELIKARDSLEKIRYLLCISKLPYEMAFDAVMEVLKE